MSQHSKEQREVNSSRRQFLKEASVAAAGVALSGGMLAGCTSNTAKASETAVPTTRLKIITIEEHFVIRDISAANAAIIDQLSPGYSQAFRAEPGFEGPPSMALIGDIGAKRIADMDANGIDMQILSYSPPGVQVLTAEAAVPLAKLANDTLANAIKANPDRFGGFAHIPAQDPKASATELERCVKELGFKGAIIAGPANGHFLDDMYYDTIFAAASTLGVPLYLHPTVVNKNVFDNYYGAFDQTVSSRLSTMAWGWHIETGVHAIRLILSGVFDRHPDLQIILGHWGEIIPFYLERINQFFPTAVTHLKRPFKDYVLNNIYITPSGMFNTPQFTNALEMMGADRIIYSVDFPFYGNAGARAFLENAQISQDIKEKIAYKNAQRLLKL